VGGFIGGFDAVLIENGAQHLGSLQNHFYHMLVRVIPGACSDIRIQYEDVH